jgi:hypothetical protein
MKMPLLGALALSLALIADAHAFCGFYVAKADTKLFNKASKVVLARKDDKTVLTMINDFEGDAKDFAVVIPVPTFLEKDQIHVGNQSVIDHLDAYSSPRLVEYWDEDPCERRVLMMPAPASVRMEAAGAGIARAKSLGVKIEAQYTVGEYDIVILSAEQSNGLETWLIESGYKIPTGASEVLGSYIKQKMRFFVAKVNLEEKSKLGFNFLRPIQVAYESPKFMLPIRLGMVNANGPQELFIFALTEGGRVETTNYRTVRLPTGMDLPPYIKDSFADFYRAMFDHQVKERDMKAVFEEYAWDMAWCDPCAAEPLSAQELRQLGVFWLNDPSGPEVRPGKSGGVVRPRPMPPSGGAQNTFVTRLHVRYDAAHFPEDLVFQETGDRTNFQGRYVLRHPWTGQAKCDEGKKYLAQLPERQKKEAQALAELTGWEVADIYKKIGLKGSGAASDGGKKWYQKVWGD